MSAQEIVIVNGPNMNLVGTREPAVYGTRSWDAFYPLLQQQYEGVVALSVFQSNSEGALIDYLQQSCQKATGIILNAAAYTHTSLALADALRAVPCEVVEVHLSNLYAREPIRQRCLTTACVKGVVMGLGLEGYRLALEYFIHRQ